MKGAGPAGLPCDLAPAPKRHGSESSEAFKGRTRLFAHVGSLIVHL